MVKISGKPHTVYVLRSKLDSSYLFTHSGYTRTISCDAIHSIWEPLCKEGKSFLAKFHLRNARKADAEFKFRYVSGMNTFILQLVNNPEHDICIYICALYFRVLFGVDRLGLKPNVDHYVVLDIEYV